MMLELSEQEEKRALRLHRQSIVIDGLNLPEWHDKYFDYRQAGGITAANVTITTTGEHPFSFDNTIKGISRWLLAIYRHRDQAMQVTTVEDIKRAKQEGKFGLMFGFQNATAIGYDTELLDFFYGLGIRIIQLTYNARTLLGDGCTERTNCGLSDFGVEAIRRMNELGIVVDLSHCGYATTMDAIEVSEQPVIFSHTGAYSLRPNPRNKTDEQIRALTEKGGVIGVYTATSFISDKEEPTIEDMLDHVDYIVNLVGVGHVGIGTDLELNPEIRTKEDYLLRSKERKTRLKIKPELGIKWPLRAVGIEDTSKWLNITRGLVVRGYSDNDIEKIIGGNFLRVFEQIMG
jgi:membrane dipeptidase